MSIRSIPAAWRTHLRSAFSGRDDRVYFNPRKREYPDLGTGSAGYTLAREDNLIDRGNCESTTAPMMLGETTPVTQNATFARDAGWSRSGGYSYKLTRTANGGSAVAYAYVTDNVNTADMHGIVPGQSIEVEAYAYAPTAAGIAAAECYMVVEYYDSASWTTATSAIAALDTATRLSASVTVPTTATGFRIGFYQAAASADTEYFYVDDIRVRRHSVPGSHYLSSGYIEHLCPLADTGVIQVKFKPNFAYDTGSDKQICSWYVSGTQRFLLRYREWSDTFLVGWQDGGTLRGLVSAQYDDGTTYRNINQWITLTLSYDLTTGDTTGSSLWLDSTQDDTAWSGAIDSKTTEFNKGQIRAYAGTAGDYDIAYVKYWPDTTISALSELDSLRTEEVYWSMDGHGVGFERVQITGARSGKDHRFVTSTFIEKNIGSLLSGAPGANRVSVDLNNISGEFSDDQYAAWDPDSDQFNGTVDQKYLTGKFGVWIENHYSGDWDNLFVGESDGDGLVRSTANRGYSTVRVNCLDAVGRLGTAVVERARSYSSKDLCSDTEADSLLHLLARLGGRRRYRQYLANNGFEDATITDAWTASGGTWSRQSNPMFGTYCGRLVPGASNETVYQSVTFQVVERINVGDTFTFQVWLLSSAAATSANNWIRISERDSSGSNDNTDASYTLSGGEGYVRYSVTHTVTDADSDEIRVVVSADAGDTIDIDGAMLIRADEANYYYELSGNDADASSGEVSADDYNEVEYDIFGFDTEAVGITHAYLRLDAFTIMWDELKALALASGSQYIGMDENNTFVFRAMLADSYDDRDIRTLIDQYVNPRQVSMQTRRYNRIIGRGRIIKTFSRQILLWSAQGSAAFDLNSVGVISPTVAAGEYWPDDVLSDFNGEFVARYGDYANRRLDAYEQEQAQEVNESGFLPGFSDAYGGNDRNRDTNRVAGRTSGASTWIGRMSRLQLNRYGDGDPQILGVAAATLRHISTEAGYGNSSLTVDTFDTTKYADGAVVRLYNGTGGSIQLTDIGIVGRPIVEISGNSGFIHDAFVDWDDIRKNGERPFEFENRYITVKTQLEKLAEMYRKLGFESRHGYMFDAKGSWHWMGPGDWHKLEVGGAGEPEYIDSVAEAYSIRIHRPAGSIGTTSMVFREVYESMKFDSNALARSVVRGFLGRHHAKYTGEMVIGGQYETAPAFIYCDGTDDQDEIQDAINVMADNGGGVVRLLGGTYNITAAIEMKSGVTLIGEGPGATIIEKNCNDYGIEAVGSSGSELSNVEIRDLTITRNSSDTNSAELVYCTYSDKMKIVSVLVDDSYYYGVHLTNCDDATISNSKFDGCADRSIVFQDCTSVSIKDNTITNGKKYGISGISGNADSIITGNIVESFDQSDGTDSLFAISVIGDSGFSVTGNIVRTCEVASTRSLAGISVGAAAGGSNGVASGNTINGLTGEYGAINGVDGSSATIQGNAITSITTGGTIKGISVAGDGVIVANNIINDLTVDASPLNNSCYGIFATSINRSTISGNRISALDIDDADNSGSVYGIYTWSGSYCGITGCSVSSLSTTGTGNARGVLTNTDYTNVTGNVIDTCDDEGIYVQSDRCTVSSNNVTSCDEGVETAATADRTQITGNLLMGNTSAALTDNGTNSGRTGNITA